MITLSALIGLIIIPLLGIFAFEVARYQHGVMQLENNCDSAALAGAAMLITSRYQQPSERARRWQDVELAAGNALKSTFVSTGNQLNDVLGSNLRNAVNVGLGGQPQLGRQPGDCQYVVEPVNPANFQSVPIDSPFAKAVRVKALFTARPAFSKFMGLASLVPVYAKATAGVPVLDLVVCFDVSGSMDDSTRVSFVNRHYVIPSPYVDTLNNLWKNYQTALNHLLGFQASPPQNQTQYNDCEYWYQQAVQAWNSYTDYQKNAAQQFGRLAWDQAEVGTLANCTFNPLFADGLPLNTQYPQMLFLANWQKLQSPPANPSLPNFNSLERYFQETGDTSVFTQPGYFSPCDAITKLPGAPSNYPCVCSPPPISAPGNGFTDLIAKMDNSIVSAGNLQSNGRPQQPLFPQPLTDPTTMIPLGPGAGNYRFTYVKKRPPYQGHSYLFDGLGYLVEAQRGNLEKDRFATLKDTVFKNNIALGQLPQQGQDGYQDAYFEMCSYYSQPIGATVDALENFYQALNAVGSNVDFGLVAFETMAGQNSGSYTNVALDDISDAFTAPLDQYQWGWGNREIGTTSANPPLPPAGLAKRPILYMPLGKLHDPANDVLPDPVDGNRPPQTLNGIFETYLTPLRATNVAAALKSALDMLNGSTRKAFARQVVVLITDGIATRAEDGSPSPPQANGTSLGMQQSRLQALRAQHMGVPIFTIGVAQNTAVQQEQIPFLGDQLSAPSSGSGNPPNGGLAAISSNGAQYFPVTYSNLRTSGSGTAAQTNAISQAFQQVMRSFVQLME